MRGNGINCLRIVPYSAVQFTTYEQLKKVSQISSNSCFRGHLGTFGMLHIRCLFQVT